MLLVPLLLLKWADIDWANKRFKVYSKKNERFASKRERMVPLFPELEPYLAKLKEAVGNQDGYVITRYRDATINLRTQFHRIIKREGLEPWERLFNNLRSFRETELAKDYPIHVTCYWIGNSPRVATDHYLQVREEDFAQATSAA